MITKIKEKMIHLLGGKTNDEVADMFKMAADIGTDAGMMCAYASMLSYAKKLYGLSAEEWSDKMYKRIRESCEEVSAIVDAKLEERKKEVGELAE